MFDSTQKLAIFMEGALDNHSGKMGFGLMRFSKHPIVCVIDSRFQGQTVAEAVNLPYNIPVVGSVEEALEKQAELLALGIAPSGGKFPDDWESSISKALELGLSLINGLHDDLNSRFGHLLKNNRIWDVRKPKPRYPIARAKAAQTKNMRILMIGTDMAVGKMTAGLELYAALRAKGIQVGFVPTGQTGISIMGHGIPLDAIKVDQASGAVEEAVLEQADKEVVIIEGQGSLANPGSTATLPLLRGSQATHLILCHRGGQTHLQHPQDRIPFPALNQFIALNEAVAGVCGSLTPALTLGVCLNSKGMKDADALAQLQEIERQTGLPATDVIRFGTNPLVEAIEKALLNL